MRRAVPIVVIAAPVLWLLGRIIVRGHMLISPDSATYLIAARSLRRGQYLDAAGEPLTIFPPGYPLLLAVWPAEPWAAVINLASLTVISGMAWALARHFGLPAWVAPLAVGLNPAIQTVGQYAWSEMPFIALAMVAFWLQATGRTWRAWAAVGALLGVAVMFRTSGWFFVAAAVATFVLRRRWAAAVLAAVPAVVAAGVWRAISGGTERTDPAPAFSEVWIGAVRMGEWFSVGLGLNAWVALAGLIVLAVGLMAALRHRRLAPLVIWAAFFLAGSVAAKFLTAIDALGHRLLAPAAPMLVLLVIAGLASHMITRVIVAVGLALGTATGLLVTIGQGGLLDGQEELDAACSAPGKMWSPVAAQLAYHCDRPVGLGPSHVHYRSTTPTDHASRLTAGCASVVLPEKSSPPYFAEAELVSAGFRETSRSQGYRVFTSC